MEETFMYQNETDFFQEDLLDFRMNHDKINDNSSLIMNKNHYHKSYELYYQINGEKYYFIKDKTYKIQSGDIVLINSYDLHRTSMVNNNPIERILVRINENFINDLLSSYEDMDLFASFKTDLPILRLTGVNHIEIRNHLNKMYVLYENLKNENNRIILLHMKLLTVELLILLNTATSSNTFSNYEHPTSVHKQISKAISYINSNYSLDLTLSSTAEYLHLSKFHFSRLFKSVTGSTFIDYLNIIRLKESLNLLIGTDLSISRISNDIGYSDSSYYCRIFKKYYNCSPAKYRKDYIKMKSPKNL
jgi:AraC-like DNA-binding protein/mannose-6-phosphate isomerase-like protein (cupin superfamily)